MIDREKEVKGLEACCKSGCYEGCPYNDFDESDCVGCTSKLTADALALLKEQEPEPILYRNNRFTGLPVATCPKCGRFTRQFHSECPGEETKFCPWCGRAVKWDET